MSLPFREMRGSLDPLKEAWTLLSLNAPRTTGPTATDRRRWDELHASYATKREAARGYERQLSLEYGGSHDQNWRMWVPRSKRERLERLEAAADRVGDKIVELLVRVSPRGEAWLTGAPAWWIRERLTWEDAVRPVGEPLSVEVPAPYGATRGLRETVADAPSLLRKGTRVRVWDQGALRWDRSPEKREGIGVIADLFRPDYGGPPGPPYLVRFQDGTTGWYDADEVERASAILRDAGTGGGNWEDYLAPGEARYVPPVVLPQMPDIVARAAAAGMPPGVEFMGAGMTGAVFCAGPVAYKVARSTAPITQRMLEEEAEWLFAAATVPDVAPHVARISGFDPNNAVIVRECPHADRDQSRSRWESRVSDLHSAIERDMLPHGWTAPEFKPDSYVLTTQGPVLVDASMPTRVGQVLARYVEDVVAGERPLGDDRPSDLAFYVRREEGKTLTYRESEDLQLLIEHRWPGSTRG